jgi:hypothetical protein
MRDLFAKNEGRLLSENFVQLLLAHDDASAWENYRDQGRSVTIWQIAKLLEAYEIYPKHIRLPRVTRGQAGEIKRGYTNDDHFGLMCKHYLPPRRGR